MNDGLSPRPAEDRSCCGPSCQRSARLTRARLGAPLVTYQSSAHSAGLRGPRECSVKRVESQFCFRMNSLRRTRNHAAVSAERAYGSRAPCKLIAAARKWWFGAEPDRVVGARRRWQMNTQLYCSMAFRVRRETLTDFFFKAGAVLMPYLSTYSLPTFSKARR
jgi:hypothetical protein